MNIEKNFIVRKIIYKLQKVIGKNIIYIIAYNTKPIIA